MLILECMAIGWDGRELIKYLSSPSPMFDLKLVNQDVTPLD